MMESEGKQQEGENTQRRVTLMISKDDFSISALGSGELGLPGDATESVSSVSPPGFKAGT